MLENADLFEVYRRLSELRLNKKFSPLFLISRNNLIIDKNIWPGKIVECDSNKIEIIPWYRAYAYK